jgi:hypothetical protein
MAEVLAEHQYAKHEWDTTTYRLFRCECGVRFRDNAAAHQAEALAEAGYGKLEEAQARAYDKGYGHGKHDEKYHPFMSLSGTPRPEKSRRNPYRRPE